MIGYNLNFAQSAIVMATKIPEELQVRYQTVIALLGQLARAIGPLGATYVLSLADEYVGGPGAGMNCMRLYMFVVAGSGLWIPYFFYFELYFGTRDEISPYRKRERDFQKALVCF